MRWSSLRANHLYPIVFREAPENMSAQWRIRFSEPVVESLGTSNAWGAPTERWILALFSRGNLERRDRSSDGVVVFSDDTGRWVLADHGQFVYLIVNFRSRILEAREIRSF